MEPWFGWIATVLAGFLLVSGADDLFLCLVYFFGRKRYEAAVPDPDPSLPEKAIAIWVAAWRESAVIERMLSTNAAAVRYRNVVFFVGVYPNDELTIAAVRAAAARHSNIQACLVPHDGPTSKGDCLNWIYQRMLVWEREHRMSFDLVLMHDAEDVIHPDELTWMNTLSERNAMIQTPVLALPVDRVHGTATYGVYCDDFAYSHGIEMPARWMLGGFVPSAGVGTAYRRDAIERLARDRNQIFLPGALTEDYENGLRVADAGMPQLFAPMRLGSGGTWLATREYFPASFVTARRQRTRWITGIALQAWESHGWPKRHLYWLWRDRKGLVGNPVSLTANAILAANAGSWLAGGNPMFGFGAVPPWLLWATLAIAACQLCAKSWAIGRVYGWRAALAAGPRTLLANLLNTVSAGQAMRQFLGARWAGRQLRWIKTEHAYPSPSALAGSRKRLGEILTGLGMVPGGLVEEAEAAKPAGMRLGEALVARGALTFGELYQALAIQTGLDLWDPGGGKMMKQAARMLPAKVVRERRIVPVAIERGGVEIVVSDLPGEELTAVLGQFLRLPVRFRLIVPSELEKMMGQIIL